jgi:hypothetical protein
VLRKLLRKRTRQRWRLLLLNRSANAFYMYYKPNTIIVKCDVSWAKNYPGNTVPRPSTPRQPHHSFRDLPPQSKNMPPRLHLPTPRNIPQLRPFSINYSTANMANKPSRRLSKPTPSPTLDHKLTPPHHRQSSPFVRPTPTSSLPIQPNSPSTSTKKLI